jgi:hypothetical protein
MEAIETHRTTGQYSMLRDGRQQSDPLVVAYVILLGPI